MKKDSKHVGPIVIIPDSALRFSDLRKEERKIRRLLRAAQQMDVPNQAIINDYEKRLKIAQKKINAHMRGTK